MLMQAPTPEMIENWKRIWIEYKDKLPIGAEPSALTFIVKNTGTGKVLYENQDKIFKGNSIFVGIDLNSGYYCVEGSSILWDELCAFQGLDKS